MNEQDVKNLEETYEKSQNDFEKQLSYISAGGLALTISFYEKIVPDKSQAIGTWLIITSWFLLAFTLLINLFSHQLSSVFQYKTLKEIREEKENYHKRLHRDKIIHAINWITLFLLFLGVLFIVIFSSLNIK